MTKDKFRELCEQVLVPRIGDLMHAQLTDVHQTLDVLAGELVRIGNRFDWLAARLIERPDDADYQ